MKITHKMTTADQIRDWSLLGPSQGLTLAPQEKKRLWGPVVCTSDPRVRWSTTQIVPRRWDGGESGEIHEIWARDARSREPMTKWAYGQPENFQVSWPSGQDRGGWPTGTAMWHGPTSTLTVEGPAWATYLLAVGALRIPRLTVTLTAGENYHEVRALLAAIAEEPQVRSRLRGAAASLKGSLEWSRGWSVPPQSGGVDVFWWWSAGVGAPQLALGEQAAVAAAQAFLTRNNNPDEPIIDEGLVPHLRRRYLSQRGKEGEVTVEIWRAPAEG